MAHIVPSDIARLELAGAHRHEIETLRLLQARLPDSYTVFHGVHWTREWATETVFGELDFVVVNRAGKALLVEQKNGTLEETEDCLIAHYADRSKSVVHQVQRALDHVRDKFRRTQGGRAIELDYLIYCPAHRLAGVNAAALDRSRVVDATQRGRLPERIIECLEPGAPDRDGWAETVRSFFRQTFELVPDIHAHVTGPGEGLHAAERRAGAIARWPRDGRPAPARLRDGRFKGQESPAVILVDVDPDQEDSVQADRLLFAGMTRATVRLELVMRADNPLNRRFGSS